MYIDFYSGTVVGTVDFIRLGHFYLLLSPDGMLWQSPIPPHQVSSIRIGHFTPLFTYSCLSPDTRYQVPDYNTPLLLSPDRVSWQSPVPTHQVVSPGRQRGRHRLGRISGNWADKFGQNRLQMGTSIYVVYQGSHLIGMFPTRLMPREVFFTIHNS